MTLEQNIISAIKRCDKEFVFDNNSKFPTSVLYTAKKDQITLVNLVL